LLLKEIFGEVSGTLPELNYEKELKLWDLVKMANQKGLLNAAKDVNVGGIAIALYKMSVKGNKGVEVTVSLKNPMDIFSESFSRAIFEVNDERAFEEIAKNSGLKYEKIGVVKGDRYKVNNIERDIKTLKSIYFDSFKELIESDL